MGDTELHFKITALKPEILSLDRCLKYLTLLSKIYGNTEKIHLIGVQSGSAVLAVAATDEAAAEVENRVASKTPEMEKSYDAINKMLAEDNSEAELKNKKSGKVIQLFPGKNIKKAAPITVTQDVIRDGELVRIGGKDETIPALIRDMEGKEIHCTIKGKSRAKELSKYFLGETLRIRGTGKLTRNENGVWSINEVIINNYEVISDEPAEKIFNELRSMKNNGWKDLDDPEKEWLKLREA